MCVCVYVCLCVCLCVCVCVCMWKCVFLLPCLLLQWTTIVSIYVYVCLCELHLTICRHVRDLSLSLPLSLSLLSLSLPFSRHEPISIYVPTTLSLCAILPLSLYVSTTTSYYNSYYRRFCYYGCSTHTQTMYVCIYAYDCVSVSILPICSSRREYMSPPPTTNASSSSSFSLRVSTLRPAHQGQELVCVHLYMIG